MSLPHGPLPCTTCMARFLDEHLVRDFASGGHPSEQYSITIDLSCTTCVGLVQNGLRSTGAGRNHLAKPLHGLCIRETESFAQGDVELRHKIAVRQAAEQQPLGAVGFPGPRTRNLTRNQGCSSDFLRSI